MGRCLFLSVLVQGCTGGVVTDHGVVVQHAIVDFWQCGTASNQWEAVTSGAGTFSLNPYSATSSAFNSAKYLPEGLTTAVVVTPEWYGVATFTHAFAQSCPLTVNNAQQERPCALYEFSVGATNGGSTNSYGAKVVPLTRQMGSPLRVFFEQQLVLNPTCRLDATLNNILDEASETQQTMIDNLR